MEQEGAAGPRRPRCSSSSASDANERIQIAASTAERNRPRKVKGPLSEGAAAVFFLSDSLKPSFTAGQWYERHAHVHHSLRKS